MKSSVLKESQEHVLLSKVVLKVSVGKEIEAEQDLLSFGEHNLSASSLDLLARLSIARGDTLRARALWQSALNRDTAFQPAVEALRALESPWILYGVLKWGLKVGVITVLLAFSLIGIGSFFLGGENVPPAGAYAPPALDPVQRSFEPEPDFLPLKISGCLIENESKSTRIIFKNGLFNSKCELADSAMHDVKNVAKSIMALEKASYVVIEGHALSGYHTSENEYVSRYDSAKKRASMVENILVQQCGVPRSSILATTAVGFSFPFREGTEKAMARNETVVIRLVPYSILGELGRL